MFLIMGIQDKTKVKSISNPLPCHVCDGANGFELYDTYHYFHLFFLPVWTWGHEHSLKCNKCGSVYNIKKESADKLRSKDLALTYWDLEPVGVHAHAGTEKTCVHCGYKLEKDFEFCPKCGHGIQE